MIRTILAICIFFAASSTFAGDTTPCKVGTDPACPPADPVQTIVGLPFVPGSNTPGLTTGIFTNDDTEIKFDSGTISPNAMKTFKSDQFRLQIDKSIDGISQFNQVQ